METERVELVQVNKLVEATNAVAVPNPIREELIRTLSPVAERMAGYEQLAKTLRVVNQAGADDAARVDKEIAADIKLVEGNDVLSKIIRGLDQLHGKAVAVRSLFVGPMKGYRKTIRQPVLDWEADEKKKADDLARKLNAEATAKAAKEQAALLKKADAVKTPEKQEAYREQAAATVAPTVHVEVAKSGMRSMGVVTCEIVSITAFVEEAAKRTELCGYIDQDALAQRLKRARIQNPMFDVAGVKFGKKTV